MTFSIFLPAIQTLMLISVRLVAFLVVAPPFSYRAFPATVKMMLALGIALSVFSTGSFVQQAYEVGPYILAILFEVLTGAVLGFLVFQATTVAGAMIDQMGGFAMASAFDPLNLTQNTPMSRLFQMTTLVLLFASNAHLIMVAGIIKTFTVLPLGSWGLSGFVSSLGISQISQLFVSAVQIAGPLMIVMLLADVGLGLLTRVAPALNAFAMGFPLKIYLTLSLGALLYLSMPNTVNNLVQKVMTQIFGALS